MPMRVGNGGTFPADLVCMESEPGNQAGEFKKCR
jgi:hypothetical protein